MYSCHSCKESNLYSPRSRNVIFWPNYYLLYLVKYQEWYAILFGFVSIKHPKTRWESLSFYQVACILKRTFWGSFLTPFNKNSSFYPPPPSSLTHQILLVTGFYLQQSLSLLFLFFFFYFSLFSLLEKIFRKLKTRI